VGCGRECQLSTPESKSTRGLVNLKLSDSPLGLREKKAGHKVKSRSAGGKGGGVDFLERFKVSGKRLGQPTIRTDQARVEGKKKTLT